MGSKVKHTQHNLPLCNVQVEGDSPTSVNQEVLHLPYMVKSSKRSSRIPPGGGTMDYPTQIINI